MLASPLVAGNDPRKQSALTTSILTNKHAIAINQDALGRQASVVQNRTVGAAGSSSAIATQVWVKPLSSPTDGLAVAFLNRQAKGKATITLEFSELGPGSLPKYDVFDIWNNRSLGTTAASLTATVDKIGLYLFSTPALPQ